MRSSLLALCLLAATLGTAQAAALDPAHVAAIDQAADAFLAKAAADKKTGMMPRQIGPDVAPLLDTVFDTRGLSHGALPYADLDRLDHWLTRIIEVGQIYAAGSKAAHDLGLFAPETGRYIDAAVAVLGAMADAVTAELDARAGETLSAAELHKIDGIRGKVIANLSAVLAVFGQPGITVGWSRERLALLTTAAPSFARLLKPADIERLRRTALRQAQKIRDKTMRGSLGAFAVALAEPRAPLAAPASAAGAEIALESDGHGYTVAGRINGATPVKFIVDSGAGVVSLPKDLVDEMSQAGTIAAADLRGRNTYVTADGKGHHGTWLMLRQLEIGGHLVTNVMASVAPAHAHPLLGMSFLGKFKSWTLDNKRHVLIVAE